MLIRSLLILLLGFTGSLVALHADPLAVGAPAPKLQVTDQDGKPLDLGALFAKGTTLVYFYPKAGTPGCTTEACSLRDAFTVLQQKGINVIGVSLDTAEAQKKFQTENHLPFTLVPDPDHAVSKAFGVPAFLGFDKRQSFLIQNGVVTWRDLEANPSTQADEVLKKVDARAS